MWPSALVVLDGLYFEELLETVDTQFTSDSGLLVTTERREEVEGTAVDLHLAGTNLARDLEGLLVRTRPHATGETVERVIRERDGFVFRVVGDDRENGPKISSWAIVMSLRTSEKMVGWT